MSTNLLASILCAIKLVVGTGQWDILECEERAREYTSAANKYHVDALLLISLSVYECDLDDYKDVVYNNSEGIYARDICPMGFRIKTELNKTRGGMSRQEVINKAAKLLAEYKKYHNKKCSHKNHSYVQHYNTGYQRFDNNYDDNVLEIYTALRTGKSTLRPINPRTREIANNIRRVTGHVDHQDYKKNCRPRSSCVLASF